MPDRLGLEPVLDMQATGRLADELRSRTGALELDASAVEHLGALAAQLLLSACQSAPSSTIVITPSPAFLEGMQRLGLPPSLVLG